MATNIARVVSDPMRDSNPMQRQESTVKHAKTGLESAAVKVQQKKNVEKGPDIEVVKATLDKLIKNTRLRYDINEKLNRVIVKVIDKDTNQVIKELPNEDLQKIQEHIKDTIGILFDKII